MSTAEPMLDADPRAIERSTSRSFLVRHDVSVADALVAALALLFAIAFGPTMAYPSWTPRLALILVALPCGVLALVAAARARDRAALFAIAAAVWVVLAAAGGSAAQSALTGFAGRDLSALVFVGAVALWALGRQLRPSGVVMLRNAALAGLVLSAVVGVLQVLFQVDTGYFALNSGRPSGLASNPVYFGGLMAAGLVIAAGEAAAKCASKWHYLPIITVLAVGLSVSGSRVALAATVVMIGFVAIRSGVRAMAAPTLATLVGVALGWRLDRSQGSGGGVNALDRTIGSGSLGIGGRMEVWGYALDGFREHWFTGWGFGRFQAAVQGKYSPELVGATARSDIAQPWFDAHNIFIGTLVAAGAIGFLLIWGWVVLAARRCSGPLAWGCAALLLTWLLQPAALPTLPLAALMFGAAAVEQRSADAVPASDAPIWGRHRLGVLALALGILMGGLLVVNDVNLYRATEALDPHRSEQAARWWPGDPVVASLVAQVWAIDTGDPTAPEAIEWWRKATQRNPDRPYWWSLLGIRLMLDGQLDAADAAFDRALELQPTHYLTRQFEVQLAVELKDADRLRAAVRAACEVDAPQCDVDVEMLIARFLR